MKKAYIAPSTTLYEVKTGNMLALSTVNNPTIGEGNKEDIDVLSNHAEEGYWSDNSFSSDSWE